MTQFADKGVLLGGCIFSLGSVDCLVIVLIFFISVDSVKVIDRCYCFCLFLI